MTSFIRFSQSQIETSLSAAKIVHYRVRRIGSNRIPIRAFGEAPWDALNMLMPIAKNVTDLVPQYPDWIEAHILFVVGRKYPQRTIYRTREKRLRNQSP